MSDDILDRLEAETFIVNTARTRNLLHDAKDEIERLRSLTEAREPDGWLVELVHGGNAQWWTCENTEEKADVVLRIWNVLMADTGDDIHARKRPLYAAPLPEQPSQPKVITRDVVGCSACGGNHKVAFHPLAVPHEHAGKVWTHVGQCPFRKEPIWMRITDQPNV